MHWNQFTLQLMAEYAFGNNWLCDLFFTNTLILLSTWNHFARNEKSSLKYSTMQIFVSISFKLVFLQLKEIIRTCMGKGLFAPQSPFDDFHTNPCIFLSFQTTFNFPL